LCWDLNTVTRSLYVNKSNGEATLLKNVKIVYQINALAYILGNLIDRFALRDRRNTNGRWRHRAIGGEIF
jgi:hypothetical protein